MNELMAEVEILRYRLVAIEDTLRLVNNIYNCQDKDTCLKRMVCKSWDYAKEALDNSKQDLDSTSLNSKSKV